VARSIAITLLMLAVAGPLAGLPMETASARSAHHRHHRHHRPTHRERVFPVVAGSTVRITSVGQVVSAGGACLTTRRKGSRACSSDLGPSAIDGVVKGTAHRAAKPATAGKGLTGTQ
jgi:hypothetical protein